MWKRAIFLLGSCLVAFMVLLISNKSQWFGSTGGSNYLSSSMTGKQPAESIGKKREIKRAEGLLGQGSGGPLKKRSNSIDNYSPDSQSVFPKVCQSRFEKIASTALSDLINEIKVGGLGADKLCEQNEASQLEHRNIKVNLEECFTLIAQIDETETDTISSSKPQAKASPKFQECVTALMYLRASIMDELFPDSELENLSPQVLANKIFWRLESALTSEDERKRVLGIAEELTRKEPNLYAAHKTVAILFLFEPGTDGKINPDNPKLLEALAVCKEFGVNDPELDEVQFVRLAAAGHGDKVGVVARSILEENPKSAVANYYLASDFFKKGDRDEAVRLLTLANSYAPNDERIRITLEKSKSAKPTDKIFSSQMSLSFTDGVL